MPKTPGKAVSAFQYWDPLFEENDIAQLKYIAKSREERSPL